MRQLQDRLPNLVPALSAGKHRSPRRGACFMEMASYLAGERWSDHPRCTHPLLAGLARLVNDHTTDGGRSQLVELIPSVIGLTSDDGRVDARIAWRCAAVALPVVAAERQNALAVAVIAADRVLADLEQPVRSALLPASDASLALAPRAAEWASRYAGDTRVPAKRFRRTSAPSIVRTAVPAIARACVATPDELLRQLLADAIDDVNDVCGQRGGGPPTRGKCDLTAARSTLSSRGTSLTVQKLHS